MRSLRSLSPLAVLVIAAAGCQCHKPGPIEGSYAAIDVLWTDPGGTAHADRDATYDFGQAFVGDRIAKQMKIRNGGLSALKIVSLTQVSGAPVAIGDPVPDGSYFEVKLTPPVNIEPSAEVTVDMFFTPKAGFKHPLAVLTLAAEGTRPDENTATITLMGTGNGGLCDLPDVLDFGKVPINQRHSLGWAFSNPAPIAATANVGTLTGADATSFTQDVTGAMQIPASGAAAVSFTFAPTELRMYTATVMMKGPAECPEGQVTLKGEGTDPVLTWTPETLDFGYVTPNVSSPRNVVFTNPTNADVQLSNIAASNPDFQVASTLTVPATGMNTLVVACKPSSLGPRTGTLTFDTGVAAVPHGSISLSCVGGGPKIKVTPQPDLNFGKVAFFPSSPTYNVTRRVTIQNVGTMPANPDPYANLFLGSVDAVNGPGQFPLLELTGPDAQEFSFGLPSYNATAGLEATVGKNLTDVLITLTPASLGMKHATLTIHSNDPASPTVTVNITADAEMLPPCNLAVAPMMIDFGLVTPPDHKDVGVKLTNLGMGTGDTCFLSGIEMASGSDAAFSVVGGTVDMKELQPGEVYTVMVRVWPMSASSATTQTLLGRLHLNVASPTNPEVVVPVQAEVGPACLVVVPDSFDFGNVKKDCNTPAQEFIAYNTCAGDVYVNGVTMQSGAGEAAGGPNCPGTAPCPEFILTATPTIPQGGLKVPAGGVVQFSAKYHPIDFGADSGAVAINAIQGGQNVTTLIPLQGNGDTAGQQTDTFVQAVTPKADVLLIVDDSCSMADKQMALAMNFDSFLQYAVSTNTDWQIGVTTTDAAPPDCTQGFCVGGVVNGKLLGDATNPKILTSATPSVTTKFQNKVNVGTNGGNETGLEAAVKALTAPLITTDNAGFLRTDANLAVVVVSDAGDQGGKPYSYYLNRLRNVKGYQKANMFTLSDIGPYLPSAPTGCSYDDYTDSSSYGQLVADTNGVKAEICTSNWAANLQNLGKTAFGYRTTFFLTYEPDLTGGRVIDVKIDGNAVPSTAWTYSPTTLSIEFDPAHTPGPGQTLGITYYRACL